MWVTVGDSLVSHFVGGYSKKKKRCGFSHPIPFFFSPISSVRPPLVKNDFGAHWETLAFLSFFSILYLFSFLIALTSNSIFQSIFSSFNQFAIGQLSFIKKKDIDQCSISLFTLAGDKVFHLLVYYTNQVYFTLYLKVHYKVC